MQSKRKFATFASVALLGLAGIANAAPNAPVPGDDDVSLEMIERPGDRFDRSLELGALTLRYQGLREQARGLGVTEGGNALGQPARDPRALRAATRELAGEVKEARTAKRQERREEQQLRQEERQYAATGGSVAGVSSATLESIAACESGGDPTAVNAAGYYGKYQFDMGTWASVGGSGNPAEASEAEQDHRAAQLYAQAGASPWPVCGS